MMYLIRGKSVYGAYSEYDDEVSNTYCHYLVGTKGIRSENKNLYPSDSESKDVPFLATTARDGKDWYTHDDCFYTRGVTARLMTLNRMPGVKDLMPIETTVGIAVHPFLDIQTKDLAYQDDSLLVLFFKEDVLFYDGHTLSVQRFRLMEKPEILRFANHLEHNFRLEVVSQPQVESILKTIPSFVENLQGLEKGQTA